MELRFLIIMTLQKLQTWRSIFGRNLIQLILVLYYTRLVNPHILHKCVVAQFSSYKWNMHHALVSALFSPLHSNTNQKLLENHFFNQSSHYEKYGRLVILIFAWKVKYPVYFFVRNVQLFAYVTVQIKIYLKNTSVIYKNTDNFHYAKEAI